MDAYLERDNIVDWEQHILSRIDPEPPCTVATDFTILEENVSQDPAYYMLANKESGFLCQRHLIH